MNRPSLPDKIINASEGQLSRRRFLGGSVVAAVGGIALAGGYPSAASRLRRPTSSMHPGRRGVGPSRPASREAPPWTI